LLIFETAFLVIANSLLRRQGKPSAAVGVVAFIHIYILRRGAQSPCGDSCRGFCLWW